MTGTLRRPDPAPVPVPVPVPVPMQPAVGASPPEARQRPRAIGWGEQAGRTLQKLSQQTVCHVPLGSVFVRAGIHICEFFELHGAFSPESINDLVLMNRPDPAHPAPTALLIGMDTFGDLKQGIMSYLFGVFEC